MSRLYLDPDEFDAPEPEDRCGTFDCKLRVCDGECAPNRALRSRAARLESERLGRLERRAAC